MDRLHSVVWTVQLAIQRDDRAAIENEVDLLRSMQVRSSGARAVARGYKQLTERMSAKIRAASELAFCVRGKGRFSAERRSTIPTPRGRRLLDAARGLSVDLADAESGDGLMARGLSEREAGLAQLVAGKTYKEWRSAHRLRRLNIMLLGPDRNCRSG
ncbi:MAG: hypothetical protein R2706_15830 [Acidimicrobiales bacterium]